MLTSRIQYNKYSCRSAPAIFNSFHYLDDNGTTIRRSQVLPFDNASIVSTSGVHNTPDSRAPFSERYNIPLRQRG